MAWHSYRVGDVTCFEIIEAKEHHCGQMARRIRWEHRIAVDRAGSGDRIHKELRSCFEQSSFCRAWLIDGKLAALGGVTDTALSSNGMVWLVLTEEAKRYPVQIVKEARCQLRQIMQTKRELTTTILSGDAAAMRLAVFLGFHVSHDGLGSPAVSRFGRRTLVNFLNENSDLRLPVGNSYVVPMGYHEDEAA
jgi:hypothetical protein